MPMDQRNKAHQVLLPHRVFLYTLDQIAVMLDVTDERVRAAYIYFEGRTGGLPTRDEMIARNIAPKDEKPDWRVAENDFVRWCKRKGFRFHERGWGSR